MAREHKTTPQYPIIALPLEDTDIVEVWRDGKQYYAPFATLGGVPDAHAPSHGLNGTDSVGTDTPDPNVIPVSDGQGTLDSWISDASITKKGKVQLADSLESAAGKAMQSNDPRGSNARTPTAHVDSHLTGSDQIPDATTSARGLMGNGDKSKLEAIDTALIPSNDEKAALGVLSPVVGALAGTSGTPSAGNPFITDEDARLELIPSAGEKAALAGTEGTPSGTNKYVTDEDGRLPTAGEKAALAGSYGTPSATNKYVTESDPVLSSIGGGGGSTGVDLLGIGMLGTGLYISGVNYPALAALSSTDIAFIDMNGQQLKTYTFDGTDWTQKGNALSITGVAWQALAALNSTDIAYVDATNKELRCYTFNGTNWSQKGNGLTNISSTIGCLAALSSTDIAFIDTDGQQLKTYTFDGTDWTQKGNALAVPPLYARITAFNSTDIVIADYGGKDLLVFTFDGSDWSRKGNSISIAGFNDVSLTAINSTDVAFIDNGNAELLCYTFDGTNWAQKGNGLSIANFGTNSALASLASTDVAYIDNVNGELRTYNFLFGYDSASVNIAADYEVPEIATGKSIVIRRASAYDGNPVTITPPSGATFEGLSEYRLYEQYSSVTLERIGSTVFVIQDEKINKLSEVGEIKPFASTVPKGYKACDGSAISRTTFPVLFAAIGTTFGAGNGSTTFNLPDLRETVLVGTGTRGSGVTAHDTYTLGQFKDDQMQGHYTEMTGFTSATAFGAGYLASSNNTGGGTSVVYAGNPTTDTVNGTPRTGSTTRGKQMGVNYAIRYA